MSKLYRSMLWSGLVVAGVAACGDDVSIVQPPPPVLTVHSISVAPNGVTVPIGVNVITMSAAVNADAGVTDLAVVWSTSDAAKATVSQTGQVTTLAAGSVAIIACSHLAPSVCGNATLTISTTAPTVTGVSVVPAAPFIVRGGNVQLVASVQGTNAPAQTVTWQPSPNPAIATVSATGLVTAPANATAGTVAITACSTVAGFTNVCGSSAVTVQIPDPAQVFVNSVTFTNGVGQEVPVVLTNVFGQVQVNIQINTGAQQVQRVDALIGGTVVASQVFAVVPSAVKADESADVVLDVTLSTNTTQLRKNGSLFLPVVFNGNQAITANLYVVGATLPIASNAIPVVMNNPDAAVKVGTALTLVNNSSTPSFTDGAGNVWFTGTQTSGAVNYISFSTVAPTALPFTSSVCGASNSSTVTGTATSGLSISSTFTCANVEGANAVTGVNFGGVVYPTLLGPDGTAVVAAAGFSNVGTAFCVPKAGNPIFTNLPPNCDANSDQRWNMINPGTAPTLPAAVRVDNKAPVVTLVSPIAFNALFDQFWVNASYNFLTAAVTSVDGGTGVASEAAFAVASPALTCSTATPVTTGADLAETLVSDGTPDGYKLCARATDNLGNVSALSALSNFFGVDKVAPLSRLAGTTAATPLIAPFTAATVSAIANTTIYGDGTPQPIMPATDAWGLEAQDTRSGFNQNAVAGFPSNQTLTRLAVSGPTACGLFTSPMGVALSDTWVRVNVLVNTVDCLLGIGYYNYSGVVTDRAGNTAPAIVRNFAQDHVAAPTLASIGASVPLYTAGTAAPFFVFGSDDLEIIEGDITMSYPNLGLVTATIEGITYPLSQINGTVPGLRWDGLLNNIVTAGTITVPNLLGRVDFTCTGAAAPYASCGAADGVATVAAQFDNVNATDDGQSPDSVRAVAYDVASNVSNAVASGLLSIQTSDVAQQWVGADLITWQVLTPTGATIIARHMASTSITAPYFDSVLLARVDAGATDLRVCGTFPAPALTDNGLNRFWTYTITKPTGSAQCATGGNWYAIGLKGAAALVTQGQP